METTIKPNLPYKKSVLSDGTIEVELPVLRFGGALWVKTLIAAAMGVAFAIFMLGDALSVRFNLSGWFILPTLALAAYVPYLMWRRLLMKEGKKFYIIPQQGIRIEGKQLAFADMDHGSVHVDAKMPTIGDRHEFHIVAKMSGVGVSLLAFMGQDAAMAVAHLINENRPRPRPR